MINQNYNVYTIDQPKFVFFFSYDEIMIGTVAEEERRGTCLFPICS